MKCSICGNEGINFINKKCLCGYCFKVISCLNLSPIHFIRKLRSRYLFERFVKSFPVIIKQDNFGRSYIDANEVEKIMQNTYKTVLK